MGKELKYFLKKILIAAQPEPFGSTIGSMIGFRWLYYDSNAMTTIVRIINESVIEKIITITDREQNILEITLESMEEYEYKINDACFLYFGLNIRDYNKPYNEKDNRLFDNPVGCLSSLAISRLTAAKLRYFNESCSITEVIEQL
jgi:hypothetical protein